MPTDTYTPPEVAARYRVSPEKVIAWILAGALRAVNVAAPGCTRPRWRISEADLIAFENRRMASPPKAARRRKPTLEVVEYL